MGEDKDFTLCRTQPGGNPQQGLEGPAPKKKGKGETTTEN